MLPNEHSGLLAAKPVVLGQTCCYIHWQRGFSYKYTDPKLAVSMRLCTPPVSTSHLGLFWSTVFPAGRSQPLKSDSFETPGLSVKCWKRNVWRKETNKYAGESCPFVHLCCLYAAKRKALMEYKRLFDVGQRQHHLNDSCDSKMGTSDHHNPTGRNPTPFGDDPNPLHFLFLVKLFKLRKNHTFYISSFHRNDRQIHKPKLHPFPFFPISLPTF